MKTEKNGGFFIEELNSLTQSTFGELENGEKFATIANNKLVFWTKIHDHIVFAPGDRDDWWTCPLVNAVTHSGFTAVMRRDVCVFKVNDGEPHWDR